MDTSTNPLGCNPAGGKAVAECAGMDLDQYPSTYSDGLRDELARFYGLRRDNFVVGNGSDEMLDILFKTFMEPGETVITAYPAYSLHGFFVRINGGKVTQIDLDDDFQLDVEGINSAKGKMVIICTPNNPTLEPSPPRGRQGGGRGLRPASGGGRGVRGVRRGFVHAAGGQV